MSCKSCNSKNIEVRWELGNGWICNECEQTVKVESTLKNLTKKVNDIYDALEENNDEQILKKVDYEKRILNVIKLCNQSNHDEDHILGLLLQNDVYLIN